MLSLANILTLYFRLYCLNKIDQSTNHIGGQAELDNNSIGLN